MNFKDYTNFMQTGIKEGLSIPTAFYSLFKPSDNSYDFPHYHNGIWEDLNNEDIVYIPEQTYIEIKENEKENINEIPSNLFTKGELIDLTGNEDLAKLLYEELSWQSPSTLLEEYCQNFADWFLNYDEGKIHRDKVCYHIFYTLLSKEEQENVIKECKKYARN